MIGFNLNQVSKKKIISIDAQKIRALDEYKGKQYNWKITVKVWSNKRIPWTVGERKEGSWHTGRLEVASFWELPEQIKKASAISLEWKCLWSFLTSTIIQVVYILRMKHTIFTYPNLGCETLKDQTKIIHSCNYDFLSLVGLYSNYF